MVELLQAGHLGDRRKWEVGVVKKFKQESIYGLLLKKVANVHCRSEVAVSGGSTVNLML